jgi:hypothetical protein
VYSGVPSFAIQEMRAKSDGFELRFTEPVAPASVVAAGALEMSSYTYEYSKRYGGPEIETKAHEVSEIEVSKDGLRVRFRVKGLRPLYVHELRTKEIQSAEGRALDHPSAFYTLNRIPK